MSAEEARPPLAVTRPREGVVQLTLDRPERLNSLDVELVQALHAELDLLAADRDVRAVVLTGAGRGYCAGLNLNGYGDDDRAERLGEPLASLERQREIASLTTKMIALPHPVISAVNGPAAGGGLALVCASDVRIAAPSAVFAVSFIRAGYSACDIGVSWILPRLIGAGRAHELMLTGRRFGAEEAHRLGLVTEIVEDPVEVALSKAEEIMLNPPASVSLTKQGMWLALETPAFATSVELENRQQVLTAMTADQGEARAAFLERRRPTYRHR